MALVWFSFGENLPANPVTRILVRQKTIPLSLGRGPGRGRTFN